MSLSRSRSVELIRLVTSLCTNEEILIITVGTKKELFISLRQDFSKYLLPLVPIHLLRSTDYSEGTYHQYTEEKQIIF